MKNDYQSFYDNDADKKHYYPLWGKNTASVALRTSLYAHSGQGV
jgi:hypothetical protein